MKSKYSDYNKKVQKFMRGAEAYLSNKYGKVDKEWDCTLFLMADNLQLYYQCKEKLDQYGIFDEVTYKKNPLLSTLKDLQATVLKQVQHLGLTPYASSKIGSLSQEGEDSDLLKKLVQVDDDEDDDESEVTKEED